MTRLQQLLNKISTPEKLQVQVQAWKSQGEKVVFTNGCFDILHEGHVTYLAKSADLGTKMIVALNTDASVREQGKGEERPINPETSRMLLIAALEFVDAVVLFDSNTPKDLIDLLVPSVLVKGADYDPAETNPSAKTYIVGRETVLAHGGEVKTIALVPGFSTTSLVAKMKG